MASAFQKPKQNADSNQNLTHIRKNSANNLADEVVNLLDELLETEKKDKPPASIRKQMNGSSGDNSKFQSENEEIKRGDSPPLNKKSSSSSLTNVPLNRSQSFSSSNQPSTTTSTSTSNSNTSQQRSNSNPSINNTSSTPSKTATHNRSVSVTLTNSPTKKVPNPPPPPPPIPQQTTPKFKPSWSSALSFSSPSRKHEVDPTLDLRKRISQLEEEIKMADAFKRSLKETLGLQVESMRMDLELERERSKRLEYELSLRTEHDITLSTSSSSSYFSPKISESQSSTSDALNNVALNKLIKCWEEEKKQLDVLKSNRQTNTRNIKEHEENIKRLVAQIKEESIFLISLREQKATLEKAKNYQYRGSKPDQQLGGKLALSESNMKRLNEELEKERKTIHDIESAGIHSVVDKKLDKYIELHEQVITAFKAALEDGGGGAIVLKKQLEEVVSQRESDKEYFDNKTKLFEKQFEEITTAKESLDREKELILNRLEEEKISLAKITKDREEEANKLKADLETKHKQLENENVLLAEKMKEIRELQETIELLNQDLTREKTSKTELEGLAKIAREVEEKQLHQKISETQQKYEDFQEAFKKEVEEKDSLVIKVNEITEEKKQLQDEIDQLKSKLSEAEIQTTILFDKIVQNESVGSQITDELQHSMQDKEKLKEELDKSNAKLEELNVELEKLKENSSKQIESLQQERESLLKEKEELQTELDNSNEKINQLNQEIENLKKVVEDESNSIKDIENSSQQTSSQLKTQIEQLNSQVSTLHESLEKEKKENASITQKKNQLQAQLDMLKQMLLKEDSS